MNRWVFADSQQEAAEGVKVLQQAGNDPQVCGEQLKTDYIDLYYQHRIDPLVSTEEVAEIMAELVREGKIRYRGIFETDEECLRRAHAVCPVTAIQNRYSMMARWHEGLFPVVEEPGITYVAFSPMANGFLSGRDSFDGRGNSGD